VFQDFNRLSADTGVIQFHSGQGRVKVGTAAEAAVAQDGNIFGDTESEFVKRPVQSLGVKVGITVNGGVVVKFSANQKYTTDAVSKAVFTDCKERVTVNPVVVADNALIILIILDLDNSLLCYTEKPFAAITPSISMFFNLLQYCNAPSKLVILLPRINLSIVCKY
jgi:hypothetical protein